MKIVQGKCPVCGCTSLDYGDTEFADEQIGYKWTCQACNSCGIEWYQMTFVAHTCNQIHGEDTFQEFKGNSND